MPATPRPIAAVSALLLGALVAALVAATSARADDGAAGAPARARPNVVFLLADDLGWGDLSCYGALPGETPNLDRLAAGGTRAAAFYVASPSCTPSRAAFLAGRRPQALGFHSPLGSPERNAARGMPDVFDPTWPNVGRLFAEAGYATIHVGKFHLASRARAEREAVVALGFERVHVLTQDDLAVREPRDGEVLAARAARTCVDRALGAIDARGDRPFYLQLWFTDPHQPIAPSQPQLDRARLHQSLVPGFTTPFQAYRAAVMNLDAEVGRLVDGLAARGLLDDTLIVFTSDNGPEPFDGPRAIRHAGAGSAGPFRGAKRSLYEGGLRVPFIVHWPGHVPAGRYDTVSVTAGVDLYPTFAALLGAPAPDPSTCDGENVLAAWLGGDHVRSRDLLFSWHLAPQFGRNADVSPCLALRRGALKLLANPDGSRVELYDVVADPFELANLAGARPTEAQALLDDLLAFHATLDPASFEPGAGRPRDLGLLGTNPGSDGAPDRVGDSSDEE